MKEKEQLGEIRRLEKKAPDPSYTERSVVIKRRKVVEKMT